MKPAEDIHETGGRKTINLIKIRTEQRRLKRQWILSFQAPFFFFCQILIQADRAKRKPRSNFPAQRTCRTQGARRLPTATKLPGTKDLRDAGRAATILPGAQDSRAGHEMIWIIWCQTG